MKNILLAAVAVGATVASLILFFDKKIERKRQLSHRHRGQLTSSLDEVDQALPIQAIP